MLKLTAAVLAFALATAASAAGWRSMKLEARDMASFSRSVAAFEAKLSAPRHYVLMLALQDLWAQGAQRAHAERREYTEAEYFRQLDGLKYEQILTLADPTGDITEARYQVGLEMMLAPRMSESTPTRAGVSGQHVPSAQSARLPSAGAGGEWRGGRGY